MRRLIAVLLIGASAAWGLTSINAYKTFTREILTSSDMNSSFSRVLTGVNSLIALHPGDSTVTARGVFDSLDAYPGPNLNIVRSLVFRDNQDSLVVPGRISADTVKVNDQLWIGMTAPVVGFSGGTTAGTRLLFSYVKEDSSVVTIADINGGNIDGTVIGAASAKAGSFTSVSGTIAASFTGGLTTNSIKATTADINGGTVDAAVIGASTAAAGSFTKVAGSIAAAFSGGLTTNTLNVSGKLTLAALRDSTMDTVRDTVAATALAFSDGTSALPALANLGDLNTGIYFPAADQVGISAGGGLDLLVSGDDITVRDDINVGDDLLFPTTGVANWGAGDVTITGGTNTLTFAGATSGYAFNGTHTGALTIGGATYPMYSFPTIAGGIGFYFTPTFAPAAPSNDYGMQMLMNTSLDNSASANGIALRQAVGAGKTLAVAKDIYILEASVGGTMTTHYGVYSDNFTAAGSDYQFSFGTGIYQLRGLTASQDVQTDGSSNLTSVSDMRWKRDYGRVAGATPILLRLKPRYWDWLRDVIGRYDDAQKPDYSKRLERLQKQPRLAGFFAQEVHEVFPEGSPGGANTDSLGVDHWGIRSVSILALTVAALQEQTGRVDSLARVTARQDSLLIALTARVAKLEAR